MKIFFSLGLTIIPILLSAQWQLNGATNIHYTDGNVGIGTGSPAGVLHVGGLGPNAWVYFANNLNGSHNPLTNSGMSLGWNYSGSNGESMINYSSQLGSRPRLIFTSFNGTVLKKEMTIQNGNVGIGTDDPQAFLDVGAFIPGGTLGTVLGRLPEGNSAGGGTYLGVRGYATQQDEYNGKSFAFEHSFYGNVNNSINFFRGGGVHGGFMTFSTNTNIERMRIDGSGNVSIGTTDPKGYKLAVAGKAIAEEIVVKLQTNWPDYVFEKNYNLPPLAELEAFIKLNKHLPEIPAAKEMEANGLNIGEMNMLLLKKIEELTLYMLEQNTVNQQQAQEIDRLKIQLTEIINR